MRFKIFCLPPLPEVKAWFLLDNLGPNGRISELKHSLCCQIEGLRHADLSKDDIELLIDDFALLDDSKAAVIREEDIVCIKQRSVPKRKAADSRGNNTKKRKLNPVTVKSTALGVSSLSTVSKVVPATPHYHHAAAQSSLTSSSSCSSSASSSSSGPSSSSSDSSDSDSTSDSDTPALPARKAALRSTTTPNRHHIPPGHGKPTTHSRNVRRRRKRQAVRDSSGVPPAGSSAANTEPLGARSDRELSAALPSQNIEPDLNQRVSMSSLKNKNKRKGFKNALNGPVPAKIVFAEGDVSLRGVPEESLSVDADDVLHFSGIHVDASLPFQDADPETFTHTTAAHTGGKHELPRLIPPSERYALGLLPGNIVVTSIDVGDDLSKASRRRQRAVGTYDEQDDELKIFDVNEDASQTGIGNNVTPSLEQLPVAGTKPASDELYSEIEGKWASLQSVKHISQLQQGSIVAWKSLGIDPLTMTPGILTFAAEVMSIETTEPRQIKVRDIPRSKQTTLLDNFIVNNDDLAEEEIAEWEEVIRTDWRLVRP